MKLSGRPLAVAGAATAVAGGLLALLLPATSPTGPGFVSLLVAGCAIVGSLGAAWSWVLTLLVCHDVLRGRPARDGVPRVLRRVVLTACGLSLAGGLTAPASADPAEVLRGLPLPDRTTATTDGGGSSAPHEARVRVAPGDTLWGLAARDLGAGAPAVEVERRWREIYRANREVVGADPHLIRPGQRLLLPGAVDDHTSGRS